MKVSNFVCIPVQAGTDTNRVKEATRNDTTQHLHENTVYIPTKRIDKCNCGALQWTPER
jgi:hypothetical protein